ncbi:hypothetical protein ABIF52_006341 [Bradyrhizobium japonicum]
MRPTKSRTSSSAKALSSDSMGTACRTFLKRPDGAAPTFCEGDSALTNSGKRFSIALKRWRNASYSASVTVGASS